MTVVERNRKTTIFAVMEPKRNPNHTCDLCKTPIYRRPSTLRINKGKYCSRSCRNKAHPIKQSNFPIMYGADNPAWKGGVTMFKKKGNYTGVVYVRAPQWAKAMARKDGYIMQHRLTMATMCGRLLERTEVVHHLDHNPSNNNPENLELWPNNGSHKKAEWGKFAIGAANRLRLTM